jgi:MscS family membrane protein
MKWIDVKELFFSILETNNLDALLEVFLVIFATLAVSHFGIIFLKRIKNKIKKPNESHAAVIIESLLRPAKLFLNVTGLILALEVSNEHIRENYLNVIMAIHGMALVFCLTWFVLRYLRNGERWYIATRRAEGKEVDFTTIGAVGKLSRMAVIASGAIIMMSLLGIEISGILALASVSGISIGFAAKDLIANFFGTLVVYMDKPFEVGDWISSPDKEIEGTVEEINWRITKIRTFERRPLYVPNSFFTNISIQNNSRMYNRRIKETVGIRYDDTKVVDKIAAEIKAMLKEHEEIDQKQIIIVNLLQFSEFSVNILVYSFTKTTNWLRYHEILEDVLLKINYIVEKNGAQMAFPTTTLDLPDKIKVIA